jgi:hypothetical protein
MKPSFEVSPNVARIVDYLMTHDSASYYELAQLIGRDVQKRYRYILSSALRILERQHNRLFMVAHGVGVTLCTNSQRAELSTTVPIIKIRRITRRAAGRQRSVNIQTLTAEERLAFDIGRSVLAAIQKDTSQSLRNMLAREIEKQDGGVFAINSLLALPRHRLS